MPERGTVPTGIEGDRKRLPSRQELGESRPRQYVCSAVAIRGKVDIERIGGICRDCPIADIDPSRRVVPEIASAPSKVPI